MGWCYAALLNTAVDERPQVSYFCTRAYQHLGYRTDGPLQLSF